MNIKRGIALILVALVLCSVFCGAVSAAEQRPRDIQVSASLKGDSIVIKVRDNNHSGAVTGINIQVVDVTTQKSLMTKKITGELNRQYSCDIDWDKLVPGDNKILVRASGISDSSSDPNKGNNWMYITVKKKQDIKITKVETKQQGKIGSIRVTFVTLNSYPKGGDLYVAHNGATVFSNHYSPTDVIGKKQITTPWISVELTNRRNNVFDIFFDPVYGDKNPDDNYEMEVLIYK